VKNYYYFFQIKGVKFLIPSSNEPTNRFMIHIKKIFVQMHFPWLSSYITPKYVTTSTTLQPAQASLPPLSSPPAKEKSVTSQTISIDRCRSCPFALSPRVFHSLKLRLQAPLSFTEQSLQSRARPHQ
jgi:hypothetical protein